MMIGMTTSYRLLAAFCASGLISACGGGSGQSAPSVDGSNATLSWSANQEADLTGYRVYFGTTSRGYQQARGTGIDAGRTTSFVASGLQRGTAYFFAITAYDAAGNESDFSAEVSLRAQ